MRFLQVSNKDSTSITILSPRRYIALISVGPVHKDSWTDLS